MIYLCTRARARAREAQLQIESQYFILMIHTRISHFSSNVGIATGRDIADEHREEENVVLRVLYRSEEK